MMTAKWMPSHTCGTARNRKMTNDIRHRCQGESSSSNSRSYQVTWLNATIMNVVTTSFLLALLRNSKAFNLFGYETMHGRSVLRFFPSTIDSFAHTHTHTHAPMPSLRSPHFLARWLNFSVRGRQLVRQVCWEKNRIFAQKLRRSREKTTIE